MNRFEDAVAGGGRRGRRGLEPVEVVDLRESADDAPVIKLVHSIIAQAVELGASDIHFEPSPTEGQSAARCACACASTAC